MEIGAEKVNPYGDDRHKGEQVREMFDNIAPAYDFMNRAMTLGIDRLWRRKAVGMIRRRMNGIASPRILDVATGTGDLAILLARKVAGSRITGIDLSQGMVEIGKRKVAKAGLDGRVTLGIADCLSLPFPDNSFDCITVAYGVRNFERLLDGYKEMARVLRPGGMLCVIELSTPTSGLARPLYDIYTRHLIPLAGRLASHDTRAYTYLPESIAAAPQGADMCSLIDQAGFSDPHWHPLTFGACTIYTASKPG
ncbi:MAG: bifunctional demethylmenaquinone methyltransferase/2-methoxy-6-polyprenyl-1,4-benzoquinol methylase UbiE [Clostridium sp.]|nr:bifunctional demethylmenaquinone methyltransferase/2-methoxy-6-polyprenyl-1,4-benzoquinol methylase UbiE [Clostridium sp.]